MRNDRTRKVFALFCFRKCIAEADLRNREAVKAAEKVFKITFTVTTLVFCTTKRVWFSLSM